MGFENILGATDISASGLAAERLRMEVVANNIANAFSTRTPSGGPFRRQDVVFASVLNSYTSNKSNGLTFGGVQAVEVADDPSEFIRVYQPGHPDADADGMLAMPNVQL